jgi:hypothetical protein
MSVFARIRTACAEVTRRARHVRIDEAQLEALAARIAGAPPPPAQLDPAHHYLGDDRATLAYVICLDAVNFGSGWFPLLTKRPGLSGYQSIASALKERFEKGGAFEAGDLVAIRTADCVQLFGQQAAPPEVRGLMDLYRRAWNDLGALLLARWGGRYEGLVEAAAGRAARLVELLAELTFYRDVAAYEELEVPFYKRAQITAADLAAAFRGAGPGRFEDLDDLTLFADNLVPHVLRCDGVLVYAAPLARRVDAGELLASGSPEEVEIRAAAVEAVERCVARVRAAGTPQSAGQLDFALWSRGQRPEIKARPRHRTRCTYY